MKGLLTIAAPSYFADFCVHLWRANPVLTWLVPVGLAGLVVSAFRRGHDGGLLVPLVVLGYVPFIGLVSPVFGAVFQSGRYIGNLTALAVVAAVIGFAYLWRWIRQPGIRIGVAALLLTLTVFNAVTVSVATVSGTPPAPSHLSTGCRSRWGSVSPTTRRPARPSPATTSAPSATSPTAMSSTFAGLVTKGVLNYRKDHEGDTAFIRDRKPDFPVIFPVAYPGLEDAPFLKAVAYVNVRDNTAGLLDFPPRPRTVAGLLILDLVVQPVPATLAVFKCTW